MIDEELWNELKKVDRDVVKQLVTRYFCVFEKLKSELIEVYPMLADDKMLKLTLPKVMYSVWGDIENNVGNFDRDEEGRAKIDPALAEFLRVTAKEQCEEHSRPEMWEMIMRKRNECK